MNRKPRFAAPVIALPAPRPVPSSASQRCQLVIVLKKARRRGEGSPSIAPEYGSTNRARPPSKVTVAGARGSRRIVIPVGAAPGSATIADASSVSGGSGRAAAGSGTDPDRRSAHSSICFS